MQRLSDKLDTLAMDISGSSTTKKFRTYIIFIDCFTSFVFSGTRYFVCRG